MTDVLAISLQGMQQEMARLERISLNLANATTPGYKREVATAQRIGVGSFAQAMDSAASVSQGASLPASPSPSAGLLLIQTDTRPGTLKSTGQSLDMALGGAGYFEVSTPEGPAYTRQGSWRLDARGRLVTAQGYPIMGQGGEISLTYPNPRIDAAGQVFEAKPDGRPDAVPVAQLKVVQFDDAKSLRRMGDGLLAAEQAPSQMADGEVQLRQGFLENSNVNSMQEMVQLIQSMRHFESMQKVASGYDEMIGAAVRKLGELS